MANFSDIKKEFGIQDEGSKKEVKMKENKRDNVEKSSKSFSLKGKITHKPLLKSGEKATLHIREHRADYVSLFFK